MEKLQTFSSQTTEGNNETKEESLDVFKSKRKVGTTLRTEKNPWDANAPPLTS